MPIFKCPKCGRTVRMVYRPGLLYSCKVCGPDVILEFITFEIEERPLSPGTPKYWVFAAVPPHSLIGVADTLSEAIRKSKEFLATETEPRELIIARVERFIRTW